MLPLTYTFDDPASAIILLLAVYVGGMYGGSISAITLNTPGTNSAIATTFDGYPLAKKGKVKKALDTSLFASVFGGLFSAVLLLLCASLITKLVANFTSVEYFSLGIMGISLIAGVSGSSLPKSLISGMIGLLMACVGMECCYRRHPLLLWFCNSEIRHRHAARHDRPYRADPGGAETA